MNLPVHKITCLCRDRAREYASIPSVSRRWIRMLSGQGSTKTFGIPITYVCVVNVIEQYVTKLITKSVQCNRDKSLRRHYKSHICHQCSVVVFVLRTSDSTRHAFHLALRLFRATVAAKLLLTSMVRILFCCRHKPTRCVPLAMQALRLLSR